MNLTWACRWTEDDALDEIRVRLLYTEELGTDLLCSMPHLVKRLMISVVQQQLHYSTFVETGTLQGEMAAHASMLFRRVHTIELDPDLATSAADTLSKLPNVTVHHGDSGHLLRSVLATVETSCVFWLDGHYSGPGTAKGNTDTPILAELQAIADHPVRPHAILIDDARVFGPDDAYPSIEEVIARLRTIDPHSRIGVSKDIIWAAPEKILHFEW